LVFGYFLCGEKGYLKDKTLIIIPSVAIHITEESITGVKADSTIYTTNTPLDNNDINIHALLLF
jgi:hypothetical protein